MNKLANLVTVGMGILTASHSLAAHLPVIEVTADAFKKQQKINLSLSSSADASELLRQIPGASFNSNGPLTTIPQYRGMVGQRLSISVDGHQTVSGGPNLMDPPLQYAPAILLTNLSVTRGIAPISSAPQSMGGHIEATLWEGEFATVETTQTSGKIITGWQSVNDSYQVAAMALIANKNHKLAVSLLQEEASDAEFNRTAISPTQYERQRGSIKYSWQTQQHKLDISYADNSTDDAGTPALPMDIEYIDSKVYKLDYAINVNNWVLSTSFAGTEVDHSMTNYHLRQAPPAAMWRSNLATADGSSFGLKAVSTDETGGWTLGLDSTKESHDSDISNPNNSLFFVRNVNNATQELLSAYIERQQILNEKTKLTAGIRANKITTDAGNVSTSMAMMMPMAAMLQNNFNASDKKQDHNNVDAAARVDYQANDKLSYTAAISRKSRAPIYQELYLWLPLQATGGLADGKNYIGNINLNAETSDEIELGFNYANDTLLIAPRIYYRNVDDYIQGSPSTNVAANMVSGMMSGDFNPLQFTNVDARFYGVDIQWQYLISNHWQLQGIVNYVRGELRDGSDDLYRIAPPSARITANYKQNNWNIAFTGTGYSAQTHIASFNNETKTSGYALFDLTGGIKLSKNLSINLGINNLFDRGYNDHLAGVNRAGGSDVTIGDRLPGYGRNAHAKAVWEW